MAVHRVYLPTTGARFIFLASPEDLAEAKRNTELSKQPSKVPITEAEIRARFERRRAEPNLDYLCETTVPE